MHTNLVVFCLFALAAVVGAAGVPMSKNIFWSAMGLLSALVGVGGLYVLLSADFLAVTQLLVYIGGVLVLIIFAVMLTSQIKEIEVSNQNVGLVSGAILFFLTGTVLSYVAIWAPWKAVLRPESHETSAAIGNGLLGTWLLPFEVASVLLLATLIGAIVVARKEIKED
ncbi:MAG TPA: NADH-quinone oxidoreductase subunit J [Polyangia bacterium]|jgi:NADH:ubiquinone oxidoreductase subunit 6 (chain J)|nr:NADH-quinone oxidoreductase subunit J [Polyangia bacterium]